MIPYLKVRELLLLNHKFTYTISFAKQLLDIDYLTHINSISRLIDKGNKWMKKENKINAFDEEIVSYLITSNYKFYRFYFLKKVSPP